MTLPKSFTTITPLSKTIAVVLFITLPFAGFCLGSYYQKKINMIPSDKISISTESELPKPKAQRCENEQHGLISVTTFGGDMCLLTFPLDGYKMNGYIMAYPDTWEVKLRGAAGVNLFFGKKPFHNNLEDTIVFMSSTTTKLPLERADEERLFGSHEYFFPTPTINPDKKVISRNIETIGNKKVLHSVEDYKDKIHHAFYFYYSKKSDENMYMSYVISVYNPDEELLENINLMISTLRFIED